MAAIEVFFKVMVMHPEIQERAKAELDSFIGHDRLPTLKDREDGELPYLEAVLSEIFRWHSVFPNSKCTVYSVVAFI